MADIIKRLIAACIGLTLFVALLTTGIFVGIGALVIGIFVWAYLALRTRGIIHSTSRRNNSASAESVHYEIIETDYEVIDEKEKEPRS